MERLATLCSVWLFGASPALAAPQCEDALAWLTTRGGCPLVSADKKLVAAAKRAKAVEIRPL